MPFQPIPLALAGFGDAGDPPAPAASQTVQGEWPFVISDPPRPGFRYDLASFYLPVWVAAFSTPSVPPATAAVTFAARLFLSGVLVFQDLFSLSLLAIASTGWAGASGSANVVVSAPVAYRSGQTLGIGFAITPNFDTAQVIVALAGVGADPKGPNPVNALPAPGSLGYSTIREALVLGDTAVTY